MCGRGVFHNFTPFHNQYYAQLGTETSRRELSEDASFGIGTLLVVEQSSLEKTLQGGLIYAVVYTVVVPL